MDVGPRGATRLAVRVGRRTGTPASIAKSTRQWAEGERRTGAARDQVAASPRAVDRLGGAHAIVAVNPPGAKRRIAT
jgi:hypothetical protein